MGMAASQARYLALVARKSNCEYEGQQINQSRLILSNQSANLFTQMLGLEVPTPPSKEDYKHIQYSFKDGSTAYTMDKWVELGEEDADGYNYAVTYHYNKDEQHGSQKIKSKPQVQFKGVGPTSMDVSGKIKEIEEALLKISRTKAEYEEKRDSYNTLKEQSANLKYYVDNSYSKLSASGVEVQKDSSGNITGYIFTPSEGTARTYNRYGQVDEEDTIIETAVKTLIDNGALDKNYYLDKDGHLINLTDFYYNSNSGTLIMQSDINAVASGSTSILTSYVPDKDNYHGTSTNPIGIAQTKTALKTAKDEMDTAKSNYDEAQKEYEAINGVPSYVGNKELTPLSELTEQQLADLKLIIADMKLNKIDNNLVKCFETDSELYNNDTYKNMGGIYTYEQNGTTYYTTYYDLAYSYIHGTGLNNIEDQAKLPTYNVQTVTVPIEKTEKAIIEKDSKGRFASIRLESDSVKYQLTTESYTDEDGYADAMNQYDYEKALYDKRVSDLNAQTSIIQRQDQDLELRLKQLDTEQNALSTEIDAVAKVVKDNVEKSFKTFGG